MRGKVTLVAGGAGGIGSAVSALLVEEGAFVIIADHDEAGGAALAAQLGPSARFTPLDATSEDSWSRALEAVAAASPERLTTFVNCAGVAFRRPLRETSTEDFRRIVDVNLVGAFLGLRHAGEAIADRGSIVTISSVNGILATTGLAAYVATKSAVCALSRVAAMEYADRDVRVNTVCPGPIDTELIRRQGLSEEGWAAYLATIPAGRLGTAQEVAQAVLYLTSADSAYVTGTDLVMDGGAAAGRRPPTSSQ